MTILHLDRPQSNFLNGAILLSYQDSFLTVPSVDYRTKNCLRTLKVTDLSDKYDIEILLNKKAKCLTILKRHPNYTTMLVEHFHTSANNRSL